MKNEMKNEMNENSDDLAAIGIGAMIVFIALILVAAVAAAVIIQTAEKLQQNAQATGDDTQEQMSTKVILISTVIESTTALFSTFELAPGSEPIDGDGIGYIVVCDAGGVTTAATYAQGSFTGATVHTGDGAGVAAITLNPGTTYVVSIDITGCSPAANADNIMVISVTGGGNTYEELQYGSSPAVGDVVV
jgi:flagellin FlaB